MYYSSELNMQSSFDCILKLNGLNGHDSFQCTHLNMHRENMLGYSFNGEKKWVAMEVCLAF